MRRLALVVLLLALVTTPAAAQQQLNVYPGGVVNIVPGAVTIGNTTTAATMYSVVVPATFYQNLKQPFRGSGALHLRMLGTITTTQGSSAQANMGCSFGGTTASIALVNGSALTQSLVAVPFFVDVWVRQQGSGQVIFGNMEIQTATTTRLPFMASTIGTTSNTAPQTFACSWLWGSAATTNTLTINNATLAIDN